MKVHKTIEPKSYMESVPKQKYFYKKQYCYTVNTRK